VKRKTYEECLKKKEELERNIEELKSKIASLEGEREELKKRCFQQAEHTLWTIRKRQMRL
jgi:cell division septum initiation protein DivIVA